MGAGASLTTALPVEAAVAAPAAAGSQYGDSDLDISRERVAMDLHTAKKAEVIEPPKMKLPVNAFALLASPVGNMQDGGDDVVLSRTTKKDAASPRAWSRGL